MNNWKPYFFAEIRKTAGMGMGLLMGGLTAMDVKSQIAEEKSKMKLQPLNPLSHDSSMKLRPSSSYQFDGGKHTSLKETKSPHFSLYN